MPCGETQRDAHKGRLYKTTQTRDAMRLRLYNAEHKQETQCDYVSTTQNINKRRNAITSLQNINDIKHTHYETIVTYLLTYLLTYWY